MSEKLGAGATFPSLRLTLMDGNAISVPDDLSTKYKVILFYRGHWWPYCRRQLVGFEQNKQAFADLDVSVICASVDTLDKAQEVAGDVSFPVAYGVTREVADALGSWWEERRQIIQPSEFILNADDKILASSYSDGPLGRMDAADVVKMVNFVNSR